LWDDTEGRCLWHRIWWVLAGIPMPRGGALRVLPWFPMPKVEGLGNKARVRYPRSRMSLSQGLKPKWVCGALRPTLSAGLAKRGALAVYAGGHSRRALFQGRLVATRRVLPEQKNAPDGKRQVRCRNEAAVRPKPPDGNPKSNVSRQL